GHGPAEVVTRTGIAGLEVRAWKETRKNLVRPECCAQAIRSHRAEVIGNAANQVVRGRAQVRVCGAVSEPLRRRDTAVFCGETELNPRAGIQAVGIDGPIESRRGSR